MRFLRGWRLWRAAVTAPVVLGFTFVGPRWKDAQLGFAEARACVTAPTVPVGFTKATPRQLVSGGRDTVSVATDGFFMIDVEGSGVSLEGAEAALRVTVRDQDGGEIDGDLQLIKQLDSDSFVFSWTAAAPLEVGTTLAAELGGLPPSSVPVGGNFALEVVGEPTAVSADGLALVDWTDFYAKSGGSVSCRAVFAEPCSGLSEVTKDVPAALVKQLGATPIWKQPTVVGDVAWEGKLEISSKTPGAVVKDEWRLSSASTAGASFSPVVFPPRESDYCVTFVVTDLRTGEEARQELCQPADTPEGVASDSDAMFCVEPPNDATTEGWCRAHPDSDLRACVELRSTDGPTGAAGAPSNDASPGDSSDAGSSGCQLGGTAPAWPLPWFGALALLVPWRRYGSRRPTAEQRRGRHQ